MKFAILLSVLFSIPTFAMDMEELQAEADSHFNGLKTITKKVGPSPMTEEKVNFEEEISRVELKPAKINAHIALTGLAWASLKYLNKTDNDTVEIDIYAGKEVLHCYATFVNGKFRDLTKCEEK